MSRVTNEDIIKALDKLTEAVQALAEKHREPIIEKTETAKASEEAISTVPNIPIPTEYREIVDSVLNKNFGIEITPLSDRPAFQFTIVVPETYSNAPKGHVEVYGADRRPRVISYAEGSLGVKEWAEKVLSNLTPEVRARIEHDRVNG